ncbi:class I SAM-dependent methyltransferase [Nocardioides mangrovicus]|uniref:Class I SAM-dependent methyltransferase n=1 Tax=Nocardioides mangrovicus TaxID=2478913 RepID=A0A3L8P3X2_9ACTN|nr:class I SAM-dependent methyltransferase [Nocardioides mangrovicus]RLV49965.1 class I SAM-dependent methyltransferase [Nocardioides mangrovicus]
MRPPDPVFADPRLAVLYDALDGDRDDLTAYVGIVEEVGARTVVDVGCGTGCLAVLLAERGVRVIGVDPAAASLEVARAKPYADRVDWIHGDATDLPDAVSGRADLALMTGNVAQVFVDDEDWSLTLDAVRRSLRAGGWLAFETRRPQRRDWETWEVAPTQVGELTVSRTVTDVDLPLVTFASTMVVDQVPITSTSTLRFRDREELERDLSAHGFEVVDLREAPDRPGKEMVLLCRRREAE